MKHLAPMSHTEQAFIISLLCLSPVESEAVSWIFGQGRKFSALFLLSKIWRGKLPWWRSG